MPSGLPWVEGVRVNTRVADESAIAVESAIAAGAKASARATPPRIARERTFLLAVMNELQVSCRNYRPPSGADYRQCSPRGKRSGRRDPIIDVSCPPDDHLQSLISSFVRPC